MIFKKWLDNKIEKIVSEKLTAKIGKEPQKSFSFSGFYDSFLYSGTFGSLSNKEDKSKGTGIYKDIEIMKEKISALEKLLKVEYKKEEKTFEGYKPIKEKKNAKN